MIPTKLTFQYCFDGIFLPEPFKPVLCIFRCRNAANQVYGEFKVCTVVSNPETPNEKYWLQHNAVSKTQVFPFAYLDIDNSAIDVEYLEALAKFKTLNFNLKIPY